jgi:hypothetical protein
VISNVLQLHLVGLLKDYDVPGFRTQNVWTKEAWTNIVSQPNDKFDTSYSLSQVKQEQELKKYYHVVKELKEESLFVWDNKRKMVTMLTNVTFDILLCFSFIYVMHHVAFNHFAPPSFLFRVFMSCCQ